jgi:predicted hotdog family 3-hydroxylacyl-ACP dehydratase
MKQPQTLDHHGIAARVPHSGNMCLLHSLQQWSASSIHCTAISHADPDNPLRTGGALLSANAIEYAGQAMALHGGLCATEDGPPQAGFLASVRSVRLLVPRLDKVAGPLHVHATQLAGDSRQAMYSFELRSDSGATLVDGRATVVLNTTD